jgi:hypothetical protein
MEQKYREYSGGIILLLYQLNILTYPYVVHRVNGLILLVVMALLYFAVNISSFWFQDWISALSWVFHLHNKTVSLTNQLHNHMNSTNYQALQPAWVLQLSNINCKQTADCWFKCWHDVLVLFSSWQVSKSKITIYKIQLSNIGHFLWTTAHCGINYRRMYVNSCPTDIPALA